MKYTFLTSKHSSLLSELVSFTVILTDVVTAVSLGDTVPYEVVLVNEGGGYVAHQHHFVCPRAGHYIFTISTLATANSQGSDNDILMDGELLAG